MEHAFVLAPNVNKWQDWQDGLIFCLPVIYFVKQQLCHFLPKKLRLISFKMFESIITNIKRKFSKPSDEINYNVEKDTSGFKLSLRNFRSKLLKSNDSQDLPVPNYYNDTALSPRAIGVGESAQTEIEWPTLSDKNPNILEKFTRIVTITDDVSYDKKVGTIL